MQCASCFSKVTGCAAARTAEDSRGKQSVAAAEASAAAAAAAAVSSSLGIVPMQVCNGASGMVLSIVK